MGKAARTSPPRVMITGCSSGIGRALAIELSGPERGCEVLATARSVDSIADLKEKGLSVAAVDVTKPETLQDAVKGFGRVDIVIANAGLSAFGPLVEQDLQKIEKVLATNVTGVVATIQSVASKMVEERRGTVVVIGSISGALVLPYSGAYCSSKAAITALCDALRMELKPFGVQVVEVVTGTIRSSFGVNALKESQLPDGSKYSCLQPFIDKRAMASQGSGAMDAAEFAKHVADAVLDGQGNLSESVPRRLVAGGNALLYHVTGMWMPRWLKSKLASSAFGLRTIDPEPGADVNTTMMMMMLAASAVTCVLMLFCYIVYTQMVTCIRV